MTVEQVRDFVRAVVKQSMGEEALKTLDAQGIVATGKDVISSQTNTEAYLNTLAVMIATNIYVNRVYRNKYKSLVLADSEYGGIVQKIDVLMPDIIADESWNLVDGQSVDDMKVYKPKVVQRFFFSRTPWALPLTTKIDVLEEAFTSYQKMGEFISSLRQSVLNKMELAIEGMGRVCTLNFMAEIAAQDNRVVNLVGDYNALTGKTLNATTALFDEAFLRYASTIIRYSSELFTDYTWEYGDGTVPRFTPKEDQRLFVNSRLAIGMESEVLWNAFNQDYVKLDNYEKVNYWQNVKNPTSINVLRASDGEAVTIDNIVALLSDRNGFGIYQQKKRALSTPINALGEYWNTFYHVKHLWFNDASENGLLFTFNEAQTTNRQVLEALAPVNAKAMTAETLNNFVEGAPKRSGNKDTAK